MSLLSLLFYLNTTMRFALVGWLTGLGISKGILYTLTILLTILFFVPCLLVFLL